MTRMKKNELTYEEALRKLETLVDGFEKNTLDIDSLGERLQEARALLKFCKDRLRKVEKDITKILDHEQE